MTRKMYKIGFESLLDSKPTKFSVWLKPAAKLLDKALKFSQVNQLINSIPDEEGYEALCEKIADQFTLEYAVEVEKHIPATGPCVLVCNHPTGFAETALLPHLLFQVRQDIKILANEMLAAIPYVQDYIIPIDVYDEKAQIAQVRACSKWLKQGGLLVVFPAGKVSSLDKAIQQPRDAAWSSIWVRLAEKQKAQFVHVFIDARNSPLFYFVSRYKESLRPALFSREFIKHFSRTMRVSMSEPIDIPSLGCEDANALTRYFYELNYALKDRPYFASLPALSAAKPTYEHPIACETQLDQVQAEVAQLSADYVILERQSFRVYCAPAQVIPHTLRHIQIKREETFRSSNMGTGEPLDGDEFDQITQHVFVWDVKNQALVGGCRYQIVSPGQTYSYLSETYEIDYDGILSMGDMLDLSRTFLVAAYQKSFSGLLMLWRGLAKVAMRHDTLRFMVGAISIPGLGLPDALLDLITLYTQEMGYQMPHVVDYFKPKNPYLQRTSIPPQTAHVIRQCKTIAMLENVFQQLSSGRYKLPVLFRQYESLGLITLHVSTDPEFSDCIDVLGVWDMSRFAEEKLKLFFSKDDLQQLRERFA